MTFSPTYPYYLQLLCLRIESLVIVEYFPSLYSVIRLIYLKLKLGAPIARASAAFGNSTFSYSPAQPVIKLIFL